MLTNEDLDKIKFLIDSSISTAIEYKIKPMINELRMELKADIAGVETRLANEIMKNRQRIEHNARKINKLDKTLNIAIKVFDNDIYSIKKFVGYKALTA